MIDLYYPCDSYTDTHTLKSRKPQGHPQQTVKLHLMLYTTYLSRQVSEIDGDEACRRLVALQRAAASERTAKKAKASPPTPPPSLQPQSSPAMIKSTSTPQAPAQPAVVSTAVTMAAETGRAGSGGSRRIMSAKHLEGHVVVLGFPPRPSHLECFLRPLTG